MFILFIYLPLLDLCCGMQDLAPQPRIERRPPALGAWSLSHWATREVLWSQVLNPRQSGLLP